VRPDLPTGTVTFLFTDVEGSTRLLHELGSERYADALAEHRRLIREACAAHGGVEVDTQGDAFFFAFPTAPGALAAAGEMTAGLTDGPIQVRIGLHTGTPHVGEEGYVGGDVHRAARIAAAGRGGQVLVSAATAQLVEMELTDLGEHRLKDLSAPERIYQLGGGDFPPLKSLYRTNLPVPATPFLGRERELQDVLSLLSEEGTRLLTLTGPGGTGKTRLALQAAAMASDGYPDGTYWVSLEALRDPDLVIPSAAQALAAKDGLADHIADKRLLLLFDNFEQVVEAARGLAELLTSCPNLHVLVTSREPLRVSGEQEYAVPPLVHAESVGFFLARARGVKPDFEVDETVSEICRRLDDLPLALELAAARVKALSTTQLLDRLNERLPLLTGGGRDLPERQRTLQATIAWSFDQLAEREQRLFERLSVFAGGCTLEAAEEVADADVDTLQSLVDKSLVRFGDDRYSMLETIREFAMERLEESGDAEETRDRHAAHFARLADMRWRDFIVGGGDWRDVVEHERENLRAAVERSLQQGDAETALAVGSGVWPYWQDRGYGGQGRQWLERALALPPRDPSERRAHAVVGLGDIAKFQGDLDGAEKAYEEAVAIFRALQQPGWTAAALSSLADVALARGDLTRARQLAEESVALRRQSGGFGLGRGLVSVAEVALAEGDLHYAEALLEEGLAWQEAEAPDSVHVAPLLEMLGEIARQKGDRAGALRRFSEALRSAVRVDERGQIAECLDDMAAVFMAGEDHDLAARLAGSAERMREELGVVTRRPDRPVPERVEPAWSEGRSLTFDEAVRYALGVADG
jgi:predicted ATPase/class 3 adenylate cyclase/predicted negative regulator of RcsB-dependent stress response